MNKHANLLILAAIGLILVAQKRRDTFALEMLAESME
jgi:hypothetical protein